MTFISADNHLDLLWMPADLWQRGLPATLREAGPKVVETERGSFWQYEGELHGAAAAGSSNATMLRILRDRGFEAPDGSLPPSDPELLIDYMDQCGMHAAVTFGGVAWKTIEDPELLRGVYAAYNDFAVDVGRATKGRVVILPGVVPRFPEECPAQIEALAKRGVKAVEFPLLGRAHAPLRGGVGADVARRRGGRCRHLRASQHSGRAGQRGSPAARRAPRLGVGRADDREQRDRPADLCRRVRALPEPAILLRRDAHRLDAVLRRLDGPPDPHRPRR